MKSLRNIAAKVTLLISALLWNLWAFAQEVTTSSGHTDVSTTTETTEWYSTPWVWIAGAAVFVLLFAAILRGGGSKSEG